MLPIFFFNDTATTEIYTLSLHDALPICHDETWNEATRAVESAANNDADDATAFLLQILDFGRVTDDDTRRSEEHTSELQSQSNLVCRLLLEKKNIDAYQRFHVAPRT